MELVSGRFGGCVSLLMAVVIIKSNLNREAAAGSPLRADAAWSTQGVSGHQGCTPPAESNLEKAGTILAHTWRELSTAVGRHGGTGTAVTVTAGVEGGWSHGVHSQEAERALNAGT